MRKALMMCTILLGCGPSNDIFPEHTSQTETGTTSQYTTGGISGSRLRRRLIVAEDGYTDTWGSPFDSELQEVCSFRVAADGVQRCITTNVAASGLFSEATCSEPVVMWPGCAPLPKRIAIQGPQANLCAQATWHVHGVGVPWDGSVYQKQSNGTCSQYATPAGYDVYSLGAESQPAAFVSASVQAE